jgi:hypothetical protein
MIAYKIIHHTPGRIRIEVPSMKMISVTTLRKLSMIRIPDGIKDIRANPFTGTVVIKYDPVNIDIIKCINDFVTSSRAVQEIIGPGIKY